VRISWVGSVIAMSLISFGLAATVAGGGPARAAGTRGLTPAASVGTVRLSDIAAVSASDAWAVGSEDVNSLWRPLLEHWNGRKWTRIVNGIPAYGFLEAVAATSADNVWVAGSVRNPAGTVTKSLVMHWNGRTWSQGTGVSILNGTVYALAAAGNSAWAVGQVQGSQVYPLMLHWTSGKWYVVPIAGSPSVFFANVAVTAKGAAWAAGNTLAERFNHPTVLYHWAGDIWRQSPLPLRGSGTSLDGIAAGLAGTIWGEGEITGATASASKLFVVRLTGTTWQQIPLGLSASQFLMDTIACTPSGTPWLALDVNNGTTPVTVLVRWTGKGWAKIAVPRKAGDVVSIAATSPSNAWVAGNTLAGNIVILHWNGKTWS